MLNTFLGPVGPPPAAGGCRRNDTAAPAGPARAAGGRHGRAQDASHAAPDRRDQRRRGGERDRPWVRRRGRGGRAAARRRTRAPPRAGARRGAPSPRPRSAAARRARQPRTPGAGAGPRASVAGPAPPADPRREHAGADSSEDLGRQTVEPQVGRPVPGGPVAMELGGLGPGSAEQPQGSCCRCRSATRLSVCPIVASRDATPDQSMGRPRLDSAFVRHSGSFMPQRISQSVHGLSRMACTASSMLLTLRADGTATPSCPPR